MAINFESTPDDRIDNLAYELADKIFDHPEALLTNESAFEDFESLDDIPGHELIKLSAVPADDLDLYQDELERIKANPILDINRIHVWYPPITELESRELSEKFRAESFAKIEKSFGVSMAKYPDQEPLYFYKVAEYIERMRLEQVKKDS